MREFKFRAWDLEKKEWINPAFIEVWDKSGLLKVGKFDSLGTFASEDRFIIQQFTGLKDKNGVEIYEGDIVKFDDSLIASKPYVGKAEVFWCSDLTLTNSPQWAIFAIGEKSGYYGSLLGEIEVIGNIFENKELLT